MNALLASQVDYVCDPILGPLPHVRAGTIKAYAIAAAQRHPALPDVPTSAGQGLQQFSAAPFFGVFAPKGTPRPVLDRLVGALDTALDDAAARRRLIDLGAAIAEKDRRGPDALAALVKSEIARLTPILEAASRK
jgi:tripartite-type tricarboxylate transporter receptor subunit TctC